MALLEATHMAARTLPAPPALLVAHANHCLRGLESDQDQAHVETAAAALGLECVVSKLRVRDELEKSNESVEMIARRMRHRFLTKVARQFGSQHILLGHHANDQAELLLLRLLRGSGSDGLAGMQQTGPSPVDSRITLVRPLLEATRIEITEWIQSAGVAFRCDQSNLDRSIPRNNVRAALIPFLEREFSPQILRHLGRTAEILFAESEFIREEAAKWISNPTLLPFAQLPIALQRAVLREQMWQLGHTPEFDLIERLRLKTSTVLSSPGGEHLVRDQQGIVQRRVQRNLEHDAAEVTIRLVGKRGLFRALGRTYRWSIRSTPLPFGLPGVEQFDFGKVGRALKICHWQRGDRFQPLGYPAASKLQDIFTSRKISSKKRRMLPIMKSGCGDIFFVESLPPGHVFKVSEKTRQVLVLRSQSISVPNVVSI